ncbi:MAG TPA: ROK family protein [Burkholderiales bacterium]|nr:ROK family protein [Burkholderiales bacterium]
MATRQKEKQSKSDDEAEREPAPARPPAKILAVDIGGSKVKFLATGETEPRKIPSGPELSPSRMVQEVRRATRDWKYAAVSIGYPGQVGGHGPMSEPGNLGHGWVGFDFAAAFECPVRITNDAAMQALGSYDGGRMLFIGLGTGVGSVLIVDHTIIPLELGELAYKPGHTLSTRLGRAALDDKGKKKWRDRVLEMVPSLQRAFVADYVVIGGGNSKYIREPLPPNVRLGHNLTAFRGGYRLWGIDDVPTFGVNGHDVKPLAATDWRLL